MEGDSQEDTDPAEGTGANQEGGVVQLAMDRRGFMAMLAGGILAASLTAEAQQTRIIWRVGYLSSASSNPPNELEPFRQGLRELGYVEGRNVLISPRFAEHKLDRLPELAADLVQLRMDVIVTFSTPAAKAASQATRTTPIVMSSGGDPVGLGLVESLGHPGGNVTGLTHLAGPAGPGTWEKVLEFLKGIAPNVKVPNYRERERRWESKASSRG